MPDPPTDERAPRFLESMPRPVLVVFLLAGVVALVAAVVIVIRPPTFGTVALEDRRPPPDGVFTHDPGRVFPAPLPDEGISFDPPCDAFATTRPVGGRAFIERVTEGLRQACTLQGASIPAEVLTAIDGLAGATIRIAEFERSGIESTADLGARIIWVNLKLTSRLGGNRADMVPVILHEAFHLAGTGEVLTAERELAARRVEAEACRQFVPIDEWPRWCEDARDLTALPDDEAIALLVSAGFAAEVSS